MVRLAAQPRVLPKGNVVIANPSTKENQQRPAHLDQPIPNSKENFTQLAETCVLPPNPSRQATLSYVASMPRPPRVYKGFGEDFEDVKKEALQFYNKVLEQFSKEENKGKKQQFFDDSFFVGYSKTLYPPATPDTSTVGQPAGLIRAKDLKLPLFAATSPVTKENAETELIQGQLGDGHLISAIKLLGPDKIKKLFVAHDYEKGIYCVMFFLHGIWEWVIIDDLLPLDSNGNLLFLKTKSNAEIGFLLLEKAFAKMHGSFDGIDGGYAAAALATLSGSVRMTLNLKKLFWQDFRKLNNDRVFLLCALHEKANELVFGIPKDRSFRVVEIIESLPEKMGYVRLQRLLLPDTTNKKTSGRYEWKTDTKMSNPPAPKDPENSFWVPAVDFRNHFVCDAVFQQREENVPYYCLENVAESGSTESDDIYMIKLQQKQQPVSLQLTIGQLETRFISPLQGETDETHEILKGGADWALKSYQLGLRVLHHPLGAPKYNKFYQSKKKELVSRIIPHAENVLVEIDNCPTDGYLSIVPLIDAGTPYYVTVVNTTPNAKIDDLTLYRLSTNNLSNVSDPQVLGKKGPGVVIQFEPDREEILGTDKLGENIKVDQLDEEEDDNDDLEDEFETFWCEEGKARKGPTKAELRKMFDSFDLDGNGTLDRMECVAACLHFFPAESPKKIQTRIRAADSNSDGKLSFREFCLILRDIFA